MNPAAPNHVPVQRIVISFVVVIIVGVIVALLGAIYRIKNQATTQPAANQVLTESQKIEYLERLNTLSAQTPTLTAAKKAEYIKALNTKK